MSDAAGLSKRLLGWHIPKPASGSLHEAVLRVAAKVLTRYVLMSCNSCSRCFLACEQLIGDGDKS